MQTDPSLPKTPSRVSASDDSAFSQEEPPFSIPPDLSLDEWLGVIIDDRYRIESIIGVGGMAAVFAAEHVRLGHQVALKVLLPAYREHEEIRARFAREALAMARLDHPHIATAIDYGELEDGGRFMVMPLVPGESLRDELHRRGAIPWAEACAIAAQVADALAAAHEAEVVHRDLKPDNVMCARRIDGAIRATVLDFGIARVRSLDADDPGRMSRLRTLTTVGHVMGTPGYMAPEQATGQPVDERTDLYALGLMLYEMVTGKQRYPSDQVSGVSEILTLQLTEKAPRLRMSDEWAHLPEELDELICSLLETKPADRPATAAEVRDALLVLAYGHSAHGKDPALNDTGARKARAKRAEQTTSSALTPPRKARRVLFWILGVLTGVALTVGGLVYAGLLAMPIDEDFNLILRATGQGTTVPEVLEADVAIMNESAETGDRRDAARRVLAYEPSTELPAWLEAAAQLEAARSCEARRVALDRIRELGDRRARPAVDHLDTQPRRGCGRNGRTDCYGCIRDSLSDTLDVLNAPTPPPAAATPPR
ncbi:MAG: serine/threonine protein kinase [Sandaracinaceae bacterium]|nr:serine/threonine protein kinase [Sandaracinaceae bacterium]